MNNETCPLEIAVVAALRSDRWTNDLRAHAASCPLCRETIAVAMAMQQLASKTSAEIPVSYRILWLRAQFIRKQEHLSRIDLFMLIGSFAVLVPSFICVALWKWPMVQAWLTNGSGNPNSNLPIYIFAGCAALVWFLTEEVFLQEK